MPSSLLADDSFRNYGCFFRNPDLAQIPQLTGYPIMVAVISIDRTSFIGDGRAGESLLVHESLPDPS
jgi:hypothetical protein